MNFSMEPGTVLGLVAAAVTFAAFVSKNMLSLRVLGIASNVLFITYGYVESLLPPLILNTVLLPLNALRLHQIVKLSREIARATQVSPVSQWLLPHMRKRVCKAGEMLFQRGDVADKIIYVLSGTLRLEEIGKKLHAGELVGEIGIFSPEKSRTQTLIAETDCEIYEMTDEMLFRLYYQNPRLGFHVVRLVAERLLSDVRRQQSGAIPA